MISWSTQGNSGATYKYSLNIWNTLKELEPYYKSVCGSMWQDIQHKAFNCALLNKNDFYTDLHPYLKSLAHKLLLNEFKITNHVTCSIDTIETMDSFDSEYSKLSVCPAQVYEYTKKDAIVCKLKDLYLLDPNLYMVIYNIFFDKENIQKIKLNPKVLNELTKLQSCSETLVYQDALQLFLKLFNKKRTIKSVVKDIDAKELTPEFYTFFNNSLPKKSVLLCNGSQVHFNVSSCLSESRYNIDSYGFDVLTDNKHAILQIDCSPLYFWVEAQTQMYPGIDTLAVTWLDDKYAIQLPSGARKLNLDPQQLPDILRKEVIYSMLQGGITTLLPESTLLAVTEDFCYIQPSRRSYTHICYHTQYNGKTFDFPVKIRDVK